MRCPSNTDSPIKREVFYCFRYREQRPCLLALGLQLFPAFERGEQFLVDRAHSRSRQPRAFLRVLREDRAVFELRANRLLLGFERGDLLRQRVEFALLLERQLRGALRVAARRAVLRPGCLSAASFAASFGRVLRDLLRTFALDLPVAKAADVFAPLARRLRTRSPASRRCRGTRGRG